MWHTNSIFKVCSMCEDCTEIDLDTTVHCKYFEDNEWMCNCVAQQCRGCKEACGCRCPSIWRLGCFAVHPKYRRIGVRASYSVRIESLTYVRARVTVNQANLPRYQTQMIRNLCTVTMMKYPVDWLQHHIGSHIIPNVRNVLNNAMKDFCEFCIIHFQSLILVNIGACCLVIWIRASSVTIFWPVLLQLCMGINLNTVVILYNRASPK